jgi:general secretion pathway protein D
MALTVSLTLMGCAAGNAYRAGEKEAKNGNWDLAVAKLTVANQKDQNNISYKIALETARIQASRFHYTEARKALAAQDLDKAADELDIATKYDVGNKAAADQLAIVRSQIRRREEEKERRAEFDSLRGRAQGQRLPLPVLSPRSPAPITLNFTETSLQKILETLAKVAGVNILFDQDYRDKKADAKLSGVSFQEALDRITFVNKLFYKVLDQNTIIVVPETPAKRRSYEEQVLRTFYLANADATEMLNLVKTLSGLTKALANKELGSLTVVGAADKVALAERVIAENDKAKGEVMIEIEILNVDINKAKDYGLKLSNYGAGVAFSPPGSTTDATSGLTSVRAQFLSSLNLSDFVVSVPSSLFAQFLQTESTSKILASPKLRAAEGKKTTLRIGQEVPVPVTTFQATQTGGTTFSPATSFQYRNVGVNLDITPKVNPSGDISLELNAEFSLLGQPTLLAGQSLPTFLTRNVTGILRLRDGETSLIGGLVQESETDSFTGVLGLQSIPILNKVFTSRQKQVENNEILISITPHILRAPKVVEEDLAALLVGTEEIPKVEGARPPLFGPPMEKPLATPSSAAPGKPTGPAPAAPLASPVSALPPASAPDESATGPSSGLSAQWSPAELLLKAGDSGSLSLIVIGLQDLIGVEAVLSYDPTLLEAVEAAPGPLLTLDGLPVGTERALETGRVRVRFTRSAAAAGSGAVLNLKVRGLKVGPGAVTIESLSLLRGPGTERLQAPPAGRVVVTP